MQRLSWPQVEERLNGLTQRVENFNTQGHSVRVCELVLFGSALFPKRSSFGDVDIDFNLAFVENKSHPWSLVEDWARFVSEQVLSLPDVSVHWGAVEHLDCAHRVIWRCDPRTGELAAPDKEMVPAGEFWQPYLKPLSARGFAL